MKEFRVAKCLSDAGTINKYAIFKDGTPKAIIRTSNDGKYFYVNNEYNNESPILYERCDFTNRIRDAIETIRNGNGDVIFMARLNIFGADKNVKVGYFLDRTIGEKLRAKVIEGWKDAEFAWIIKTGDRNNILGDATISEFDEYIWQVSKDSKPMYFLTEEMHSNMQMN